MSRIVDLTELRFDGPHPRPRDLACAVLVMAHVGQVPEHSLTVLRKAGRGAGGFGPLFNLSEMARLELARRDSLS